MIPEFTQAIFLRSLEEWGAYPGRYEALSAEERAEFHRKQGFTSLHDVLAHVGVWWEEARGIIRDTLDQKERPRRHYDFDAFNAQSLKRFRDTPESELLQWFEAERQKMVELVSSLDSKQIKIRRVYTWLDAVTLLHLKEHHIGAPRFLALDMLEREWAGYAERFDALPEEKQKAFLDKQGFPRLRDLIAHVVGGLEDVLQVADGVSKDPAYRGPVRDNDAYNAELIELFGKLAEAEFWKRYESARRAVIEMVINLPDEVYENKEFQSWIESEVIAHYFEHAL